jgi:hypothetical protein
MDGGDWFGAPRRTGAIKWNVIAFCLNPGGTNEWHCFGVVRCYEPSMMGREGLVFTDADEDQIAIVLEYESGVSHRIWAD